MWKIKRYKDSGQITIFLLFLIFGLSESPMGQPVPERFMINLNVQQQNLKAQSFLYGIKATGNALNQLDYVQIRTYNVNVRRNGKNFGLIPPIKITVGFLGFNPSTISMLNEVFISLKDTVHTPCIHSLLTEIIKRQRMLLEYSDLNKVRLIMYDLENDTILEQQLVQRKLIDSGSIPFFYLVWDQGGEQALPFGFQSKTSVTINFSASPSTQPASIVTTNPPKLKEKKEPVQGKLKYYHVEIRQKSHNRRETTQDPEVIDMGYRLLPRLTFSFDEQQLFYDSLKYLLGIPNNIPVEKIIVKGVVCEHISIDSITNPGFFKLLIEVKFPRFAWRLNVLEKSTGLPVKFSKLTISFNNNTTLIDTIFFNSGDSIQGLYDDPNINYRFFINNPDYESYPKPIIKSGLDAEKAQTINMVYKKAYNFFYIDLSGGDRMKIKTVLKTKIQTLTALKQPYYIFVSNGSMPMNIRDSTGFAIFLNQLGVLNGDPPSPGIESNILKNNFPVDSIQKSTKVKTQFFISRETYVSSSFDIVNEINRYLKFLGFTPEVSLYMDFSVPEEQKKQGYKYYNISTTH